MTVLVIVAALALVVVLVGATIALAMFVRSLLGGGQDRPGRQPPALDPNRQKGAAGEAEVTALLQRLPAQDYDVFTTVILPKDNDRSRVEMDHVVLSRFGVFVVETKRWGGRVDGSEEGDWLQSIGRHVHRQKNPFAQNDRQVRRLRQHLDIGPAAIRGVVCFTGDTELGPNVPGNVVKGPALLTYLTAFETEHLNQQGVAHYRQQLTRLARSHRSP